MNYLKKDEIFFVTDVVIAKKLLGLGHSIVDLRKDRFKGYTIFVFKKDIKIITDYNSCKRMKQLRNRFIDLEEV